MKSKTTMWIARAALVAALAARAVPLTTAKEQAVVPPAGRSNEQASSAPTVLAQWAPRSANGSPP